MCYNYRSYEVDWRYAIKTAVLELRRYWGKMIIVYESKTGFTKKYADMLAGKTKLKAYRVKELPESVKDEEIIFLGWLKAGKIQGLGKVRKYNVKAVLCIRHCKEQLSLMKKQSLQGTK